MQELMILLHSPFIFGLGLEIFFALAIIGIPIFFVFRWVFKKVIKVSWARILITWTTTLISSILFLKFIILLFTYFGNIHHNHEFSKEAWTKDKAKRYEYSNDIIESKMLIGKTKNEVREILGSEEFWSEDDSKWIYSLGLHNFYSNEKGDLLEIEFSNGNVINVKIN